MNRTRSRVVRSARQMISAVVMTAVLACAAPRAIAAEHGGSPYIGDPVLSPSKPSAPAKSSAPGAPTLRVPGHGPNSADLDPYFQVPGGGHGVEGRIGHIAGETVGRDESLTHINLQPYMFVEQNMLFSDLRMYRLNEGGQGFNVGLGLRRYFEQHDAIFGAVAYYDIDKTRPQQFQQLGLSLEMLTRWWDLRANWYVPTGDTEQILGTGFVDGSQRFEENFLLVDTTTLFGNAAEGVDVTGTIPVPWEFLQPYNVEASAGFYHFQVRDRNLPDMWGYRLRADASFFDRMLHTFVELTHDDVIDTNVIFGASLDYHGGFENRNRYKDRQYYRMSEFVRRNYNVVTIQSTVITPDVPVINPVDNEPYFFIHIDNTDEPDLNDGTFENPFDSIVQAFDEFGENADVYLVHGGSSFSGDEATLVVPDGTILLGENVPGRVQTIPAVGLGQLPLPAANPDAGPVTLTGSTGSTIDATNARLVGAFTIIDPGEHGLLVSGPSAFGMPQLFRDLDISGADGDGVRFENSSGNFTLQRVTVQADDGIDGAGGVAFHVLGGDATITAMDVDSDVMTSPTFENSGGNPNEIILIENITGGTVNLTQTTANDTGGGGIRLLNNAGNIAIGQALLTDIGMSPNPVGSGAGVEIFGGTGNTTLFGDIAVTNAAGVGFLVDSLEETGQVNVASGTDISINARNTVGAEFRNIMGSVQFSPTLTSTSGSSLTIGALDIATNTDAPAVWFNSSSGSVALNQVTIFNSNTDGILIGGDTLADQNVVSIDPDDGSVSRPMFVATGTTTINATGNAANPGFAAIRIQGVDIDPDLNPFGEAANVTFRNAVLINTRVDRGIQIENTSGRIQFSGTTTVNNNAQTPSDRAALSINDSISAISFGTFIAEDALSGEAAVEITNMPLPGSVSFDDLQINDAVGDGAGGVAGLLVNQVSRLNIGDGSISVEDGIAIDIRNVYPQNDAGDWIVRDNQGRLVLLNGPNVPNPTMLTPIAVLDANGNQIIDDMGNPITPPNISMLTPFEGYNVDLTEVNAVANTLASAQPVGIFLENNVGTFEITGVVGVPGSGGQILGPGPSLTPRNTSVGLFANNADRVIIRNQDYTGNDIGLIFQNMNGNTNQGFLLDSIRVQDTIQEAVRASDVRNITIVDSIFQNNGFLDLAPGDDELFRDTILIVVNQRPDDPFNPNDEDNPLFFPYTYTIARNLFIDQNSTVGSDAVRIQTVGGIAQGSLLTLFFQDNEFSFDRGIDVNDTPKLLNVIWNGTIDALVSGNTANFATRDRPRGFEIRQTSAADNQSQVVVTNNSLNFNNSPGAIGALFDFIGRARIDLTNNTFQMGGGGNGQTAALFRLFAEGNDVEIANNVFEFQTLAFQQGSGIGVDVQQVFGGTVPSRFTINGNVIGSTDQLAANTAFRFQQTIGEVNLFGNVNNSVFANNLFLPSGNPDIIGTIIINGQNLP